MLIRRLTLQQTPTTIHCIPTVVDLTPHNLDTDTLLHGVCKFHPPEDTASRLNSCSTAAPKVPDKRSEFLRILRKPPHETAPAVTPQILYYSNSQYFPSKEYIAACLPTHTELL